MGRLAGRKRPPRPGEGGQTGNFNALKSGQYSKRLRRAVKLPPDRAHIDQMVQREVRDIVSDLGGMAQLTAARRALLNGYSIAMRLALLALDEARRRGDIATGANGDPGAWDLAPGLQRVKGLLDTARATLLAVGIERIPRDVDLDPALALARDLERREAADGEAA